MQSESTKDGYIIHPSNLVNFPSGSFIYYDNSNVLVFKESVINDG